MSGSNSSSSSEDDGGGFDNPNDVDFKFIKTGKSRKEGVLITHDSNFKYQKNQVGRKGDTFYYVCAERLKRGCPAKATVKRKEFLNDEGEMVVENELVSVSSPQIHAKYHMPDRCQILVDTLVEKMKEEIALEPTLPVGRIKEKVLREELYLSGKYSEDEVNEILSLFPVRIDSVLHNYRISRLGKMAPDRDSYDPSQILKTIRGGEKIIVMDSAKLEGEDWKQVSLKDLFDPESEKENGGPDIIDDGGPDLGNNELNDMFENIGGLNESSMNPEEITQSNPQRVIVFTTLALLGLLCLAKSGSVDGTFKSVCRHWKQMFIMLVDFRGLFVPIAIGWLADKKAISYYIFLYLLLMEFKKNEEGIYQLYGRKDLRLRKIKCDFELSIHKAFDLFIIQGCYFHFSQALWKKVMTSGLFLAYIQDKSFKRFIRMVMALPFLPISRLQPALDHLRNYTFLGTSKFFDKISQFHHVFLDYFQATWMDGSFPPALWNLHNKTKNLTNNRNEGLNSRINRNIMVKHPNSDVLVCFIKDEFMKAEMDVKKVQQGLKVKTKGQAKYRRLEVQRENLQKMFAKGDLGEEAFLSRMGAVSMKTVAAGSKFVYTDPEGSPQPPIECGDSDDSLSETRPLDLSLSEDSDCGLPANSDRISGALKSSKTKKKSKDKKQKCSRCSRGFRLNLNLHLECSVCGNLFHKRCIGIGDKLEGNSFTCDECRHHLVTKENDGLETVCVLLTDDVLEPTSGGLETVVVQHPTSPPSLDQSADEMLLSEETDHLMKYTDYTLEFDERLSSLGFKRSPTEPQTKADGNCGLYAIMDGYANLRPGEETFFNKGNTHTLRIVAVRQIQKAIRAKAKCPSQDLAQFLDEDPEIYLKRMGRSGVHIDELMLRAISVELESDLIIIPFHAETAHVDGNYTRIAGGELLSDKPGLNLPIFIGYYEETRFLGGGHYQAIQPYRNGPVLESLRVRYGIEYAKEKGLPEPALETLPREADVIQSFSPGANSTQFLTPANKRPRSPSPTSPRSPSPPRVTLSPPPPVSPASIPDTSLGALRRAFRETGMSWDVPPEPPAKRVRGETVRGQRRPPVSGEESEPPSRLRLRQKPGPVRGRGRGRPPKAGRGRGRGRGIEKKRLSNVFSEMLEKANF